PNNPFEVAWSALEGGILHNLMREHGQAEVSLVRALELSEKVQFPQAIAFCRCYLGVARARLDRATDAAELIRRGLAGLTEIGAHIGETSFPLELAWAQALAGDSAEALETVEQVLQANSPLAPRLRPEALRLSGELQSAQGKLEYAETRF